MENLPKIFKIHQKIDAPHLEEVENRVHELLDQFELSKKVKRGERIGLTAGSRGIKDKPRVLKTIVDRLRDLGASPFVVPCMGSHGGATAEGQIEVLESLGITEKSLGAPILSSMDVEQIGRTKFGTPVLISRDLLKADWVVVVNRVKPHTDFRGEIESGLVKMMVIGMGKHQGALMVHRLTIKHGFPAVIKEVSSIILKKVPILFGMGMIENQYGKTAFIDLVKPGKLVEAEKALLKKARRLTPSLPFDQMDLLILDEMGKNISGAGMDTNVIGRRAFIWSSKPRKPKIMRIFVRDITEESHGNATGIGMADYITKRLFDKIDYSSTAVNCLTGMGPENGRIPIFFERDRDALAAAHDNSGVLHPQDLRILWAKSTLELENLYASQALLKEARSNRRLEILSDPFEFPFDQNGNLISNWS
ncbi:MAG TPA: lactate racemase domain-containing protein [Thermodesulfobacteriota bacterium]|nr:lactate racemase domain-containing protein [Thermodesulfobacteriota bacterium]